MDDQWFDQTAAWWAKTARARKHIDDLAVIHNRFVASEPYEIRREPGEHPNEAAYRLRELRPVPIELVTTVGDALHNMRSCLDSVANELARRHIGADLTEDQDGATQFPIEKDDAAFDEFFARNRLRSAMYGERERNAMRCVQPFALRDEAIALGVEPGTTAEQGFASDELLRLHRLNILDKHRRLPLLKWVPDFVFWPTPGEGCDYRWRHAAAPMSWDDHDPLIGHFVNHGRDQPPPDDPVIEVHLTLVDDAPNSTAQVVQVLDRWHSYLAGWVLPRMFAVAGGSPPPIIIGESA